MTTIELKKATYEDMELLFQWRNMPWIVALGSQSSTVSWEEHKLWFEKTLLNQERQLFLITQDSIPLGQVRFDAQNSESCEVSVYLMKEHTGKGLGVQALLKSCEAILAEWKNLSTIIAYIKDNNQASISAFKKAGFQVPIPDSFSRSGHISLCFYRAIPHNRLTFDHKEIEAVKQVVSSGQWAHGETVRQLEQELKNYIQSKHAVAVSSGLSAIRLTLKALGISVGDEVIVPAYSCVALANAVLALGAKPVPVDICQEDWNIEPQQVPPAITSKTKAILCVNTFGAPADIESLKKFNLPIIEDCSHGFGYPPQSPMGNRGDVSIISFYATKLMGAGEGGAILTNSDKLAHIIDGWRFYQDKPPDSTRLNDKMTNIEAALAKCQLERLSDMISKRQGVAENYQQYFNELKKSSRFQLPRLTPNRIWYRYVIEVPKYHTQTLIKRLERYQIHADFPVDQWIPSGQMDFPIANKAYSCLISLPIYPTLSEAEQLRICQTLNQLILELSNE